MILVKFLSFLQHSVKHIVFMTINCNVKIASIAFFLALLLAACSKTGNDTGITKKDNIIEPIDPMIGRWVLKKGSPIGFMSECSYSQTIEFRSNGNFKEITFNGVTQREIDSTYGNWNRLDESTVVLSTWDEKDLADHLSITNVTSDSLTIIFKSDTLGYARDANNFSYLSLEIIGKWRNGSQSLTFNSDGTGRYFDYFNENLGVGNGYAIENWTINSTNIVIIRPESESRPHLYPCVAVTFINERYMGLVDVENPLQDSRDAGASLGPTGIFERN